MDESMKPKTPEKIYVTPNFDRRWQTKAIDDESVEYIRVDTFIEKAAEFFYNYNQKQVLKHGARATLGCGEYTINVEEFIKYIKE